MLGVYALGSFFMASLPPPHHRSSHALATWQLGEGDAGKRYRPWTLSELLELTKGAEDGTNHQMIAFNAFYDDTDWPEVATIHVEPFQFGLPDCSEQYSRFCAAVWEAALGEDVPPYWFAQAASGSPPAEEAEPAAEAPVEEAKAAGETKRGSTS